MGNPFVHVELILNLMLQHRGAEAQLRLRGSGFQVINVRTH